MAKIRVQSINSTKILISKDNKDVNFYDKDKSSWHASSGDIVFSYNGDIVFSEKTGNFIEPKENSVLDLIKLLDGLIN